METLEEFIEREGYPDGRTQDIWETGVRDGVEWQAQRMYSEEEVRKILWEYVKPQSTSEGILLNGFLEQFKKKQQ